MIEMSRRRACRCRPCLSSRAFSFLLTHPCAMQTVLCAAPPSARPKRQRTASSSEAEAPICGDDSEQRAHISNAYACARCGQLCEQKAFATAICSFCQWRVLTKIKAQKEPRTFSTN